MTNFEQDLLNSGFTTKELFYLNKNVSRYGSTLQDVIHELGKRFIIVLSISAAVVISFMLLLMFAAPYNIISGGIALTIVLVIAWFFQPPVVTYKAWRFRKSVNQF